MTRRGVLSTAAVLSMIATTPALAQQWAEQEPGAFAAMYPNANVAHASEYIRSSPIPMTAHRPNVPPVGGYAWVHARTHPVRR